MGGTGRFLLGTTTDSGALLQIGTNTTTSAGGMVFGTDIAMFRDTAGGIQQAYSAGTTTRYRLVNNTGNASVFSRTGTTTTISSDDGSVVLASNNTTALTLDSSQNAAFAGNVFIGAGSNLGWTGRGFFLAPSDGVFRMSNNAGNDFSRLQFGGTTSSFPALQRSGVQLKVRLADNSDDAELWGKLVSAGAAVTASASTIAYGGTTATTVGAAGAASPLPALPTGYIIVNVAGTNMKVPYFAN